MSVKSSALAPLNYEDRIAEFGGLFPRTPGEAFRTLFDEYGRLRAKVEAIAEIATGDTYAEAMGFFITGNCERERAGSSLVADRVFQLEGALASLNSSFWSRALAETDVYQVMPQERRTEWDEAIRTMKVPDFDEASVVETIGGLLLSRQKFFAERVDGIFRALSGEHVTNAPQGFGKRMIINYIHNGWHADSRRIGYISDLRSTVARFMGRDEPRWNSTSTLVEAARRRSGEWMDVDGGAFRLRVYKKGTAHLEVHPEMAWRLNAVLASLYPRAIPAEYRTRPAKKTKAAGFRAISRPLPFAVLSLLAELRPDGYEVVLPYDWRDSNPVVREAAAVLEGLGGVVDKANWRATFDYVVSEVLEDVVASGCLPDRVSHQYYPSPAVVADEAVAMAEVESWMEILEPQAGQGSIAERIRAAGVEPACCELSHLHCLVLKGKGFRVLEGDFLEWAAGTIRRFDRVIMNPPFSEGRAVAHLSAGASLVKPGGRVVVILPASQRGKRLLPATEFDAPMWSEVFSNEFDGTGVSVAIMAADRRA